MTVPLLNVGVLALLAVFIFVQSRRRGSFLQPGVLFAAQLALNYPLRVLTLYYMPDGSRPSYAGLTSESALAHLSELQVPGILSFCLGYYLVDARTKWHRILDGASIPRQASDLSTVGVAFVAGIAAIAYKIATGDYISYLIGENRNSALINIVDNYVMVGWVALAGAWFLFFDGRLKKRWGWALFVAVNTVLFAYQLVQGSKTFLLLPGVVILAAAYYKRRRVPLVGLLAFLAFYIFFVVPYVFQFREYVNSTYAGIPDVEDFDARKTISEAYDDARNSEASAEDRLLAMSARFAGADELYHLETLVPEYVPYRSGRDFVAIPLTFIPRAVWPDKPVISIGAEYGSAQNTITSITPFPLGEVYWNFGEPALAPGMAAWGAILALLVVFFDWLAKYPRLRFLVASAYIAELYWMTTGESSLPMLLASLPKKVIVIGTVYYAVSLIERGHRRPASEQLPSSTSAVPLVARAAGREGQRVGAGGGRDQGGAF